jgi:hypothetical protein
VIRRLALAACAAGIVVGALPARAGGIAAYGLPQPDAPVEVTGCSAGIQFVSNGWGTSFSRLNTGADFENRSSKSAVAVLIRFQLSSVFGSVLDNRFANATGQFAAATTIKGNHWSDTDSWPGLGAVQCSISRVLFSDGSVWVEPNVRASPAPTSSATAPPIATPSP